MSGLRLLLSGTTTRTTTFLSRSLTPGSQFISLSRRYLSTEVRTTSAPSLKGGPEQSLLKEDAELKEAVLIQDFRRTSPSPDSSSSTTNLATSQSFASSPKILLTCEHASNALPRPYYWSPSDLWVKDTHWAYDIGASEFATELGQALGVVVVKAQFSRLLVDPNRPLASETLFRKDCDGKKLDINQGMTKMDRNWRIWNYYLPYHQTLGRVASKTDTRLIISVHSFTPLYEGNRRDFELGVLCTTEDHLADKICTSFQLAGFQSRVNMPWSGKEGFMYSADSLKVSGPPGNRRALMVEIRNDLASQPEWRSQAVKCLTNSLRVFFKDGTSLST